MAPAHSSSYPLGGTQTELERLLTQAEVYEPQANWLLDQIGFQSGWRAVDIGCGPIGILNLLSQRVGPRGSVVGLEREPRFVEMARAEVAKRGLSNVKLVEADALNTGLEKNSFDVVHERLVMINVSARVFTGRPGSAMPPWKGRLPDDELWKIIAFVSSLGDQARAAAEK